MLIGPEKDAVVKVPSKGPVVRPDKEKVVKGWGKQIENSIGMKLVRIPAGKFTMGSPASEKNRGEDEEQHEVEITKEFWLGIHEVTQKQFKAVMGYNPSYFSRDGTGRPGATYLLQPAGGKARVPADTSALPVEHVSWEEADEFCKKLTAKSGERGRKYRLPSEAEWEYACRGGSPSYQVYHFGNSLSFRKANFDWRHPYGGGDKKHDDSNRTCKVGSYEANRLGLHDMHGNIWEWCSDWYDKDYYAKSPREDPPGSLGGSSRVIRGGSWSYVGSGYRSASRNGHPPVIRWAYLGFRVALVPSGK